MVRVFFIFCRLGAGTLEEMSEQGVVGVGFIESRGSGWLLSEEDGVGGADGGRERVCGEGLGSGEIFCRGVVKYFVGG